MSESIDPSAPLMANGERSQTIENSLKLLVASLQLAKIYPLEHPAFKNSLDKAYDSLRALLEEKGELVIGIVGDELTSGKEIFFSFSKSVKPLILYLKERGIEKIVFRGQLKKDEFGCFIASLASPKETAGGDIQEYLSLRGVKNISAGKINLPSTPEEEIKKAAGFIEQYENTAAKISGYVNGIIKGEIPDYADLSSSVTAILENLVSGYPEFLKLSTLKKCNVTTYLHILNVAILSLYFSYKLGFSKDDISNMGIAALFHDMGKIFISQKLLDKRERLSDEEFMLMKSHTVLGAQILLKYTKNLGVLPAVVAFEHHLRYDAKGYPKLTFAQRPHIASLIVSICDVYDALNSRRSYKRNYSPDLIYNLMQVEKERVFSPELLESFFEIIGVWPIGTIAALSDKRIAVVREENKDDIFSPKVEVISPEANKEHIDLRDKKGEIKIEYALDPLEDGGKFLHLV